MKARYSSIKLNITKEIIGVKITPCRGYNPKCALENP